MARPMFAEAPIHYLDSNPERIHSDGHKTPEEEAPSIVIAEDVAHEPSERTRAFIAFLEEQKKTAEEQDGRSLRKYSQGDSLEILADDTPSEITASFTRALEAAKTQLLYGHQPREALSLFLEPAPGFSPSFAGPYSPPRIETSLLDRSRTRSSLQDVLDAVPYFVITAVPLGALVMVASQGPASLEIGKSWFDVATIFGVPMTAFAWAVRRMVQSRYPVQKGEEHRTFFDSIIDLAKIFSSRSGG